jgi:hypothetical protein
MLESGEALRAGYKDVMLSLSCTSKRYARQILPMRLRDVDGAIRQGKS